MAVDLELNHAPSGTILRTRASGLRRLADGILDGDFRHLLTALARDYEREAARLEFLELYYRRGQGRRVGQSDPAVTLPTPAEHPPFAPQAR
jgi:hypothetical protein